MKGLIHLRFVFLILLVWGWLFQPSEAQVQRAWIRAYDNSLPAGKHLPLKMERDTAGNLVLSGTSMNRDGKNEYLALKYDAIGNLLWRTRFASTNTPNSEVSASVLSQGKIYLTGSSETLKINGDGKMEWSVHLPGHGLAVDLQENVYVTGFSTIDFATAKLNAGGETMWTRTFDRNGRPDVSQAVAVDNAGNVFVAGSATHHCDKLACYRNVLMLCYDANGNQKWFNEYYPGIYGGSETKALLLDEQNDLYVSGNITNAQERGFLTARIDTAGQTRWFTELTGFEGVTSVVFGPENDLFLTGRRYRAEEGVVYSTFRLNPDGVKIWEARYYGPIVGYHKANAIALDKAGNVYVTGISPGPGTGNDWATIKYDRNGKELWVERYNGRGNGSDEAKAIAVDDAGNVYVTGYATTPEGGTEIVTIKYSQGTGVKLKANGNAFIQFQGHAGLTYEIQATSNFSSWLGLGTVVADALGIYQFEDPNAPQIPFRFYRSVTP